MHLIRHFSNMSVIGILCGLVWGLGVGFAILATGTFLGEIGTWIAFKWCCQARAAKLEKSNQLYASLTQLIREKSFMFVLVLRFSAVPGHITTAVSASAGALSAATTVSATTHGVSSTKVGRATGFP